MTMSTKNKPKANKKVLDKAIRNPNKKFVMGVYPDDYFVSGELTARVDKLNEVFESTSYEFTKARKHGVEGYAYLLVEYVNVDNPHEEEQ